MGVLPPTGHDLVINLDAIKPHYGALVALWAVGLCAAGECVLLLASDVTVLRDDGSVASVMVNVEEELVSPRKEAGRSRKGEVKALASVHQVRVFGEGATIIAEHVRGKIGKAPFYPAITDPSTWLHTTNFRRHWAKARHEAGRNDLHAHALRHYAGTRCAQSWRPWQGSGTALR